MADVWACSQCRSINRGKDRCYKCRRPRSVSGVAPTELPTVGPSAAVVPAGRYRSSAFRAAIASLLVVALVIVSVMAVGALLPNGTDLSIVIIGLIVASLATFAAWLSRVVDNVPQLTGRFPRATPRMTFLQALIPIYNFGWIPSILREALRMLDPRGNGDALVAAAILPLIVSFVGYVVGRRLLLAAYATGSVTINGVLQIELVFAQAVVGLLAVGAIMLVAVMVRVERVSAARARDVREALEDAL
jgi:hypothetical protein